MTIWELSPLTMDYFFGTPCIVMAVVVYDLRWWRSWLKAAGDDNGDDGTKTDVRASIVNRSDNQVADFSAGSGFVQLFANCDDTGGRKSAAAKVRM